MLETYFPVLVFILFAAAFGFIPIVAGWVLGPNKPDAKSFLLSSAGLSPLKMRALNLMCATTFLPFFLFSLIWKLRFSFLGRPF
jgi:NADH:ubiquinone oxidoreductase subunit 3 (subunit A)